MAANRFDSITRLFAARRSRRQAVTQGGANLAVGTLDDSGLGRTSIAQGASPVTTTNGEKGSETLFVQSYQSGSIAPKANAADHYVVTLEQGLGQTIYFTDRPERVVGTTPTAEFLANIGFSAGNPPNAALVVEKEGGATEIAVVELIDPRYDEATHTATYEVAVLDEWEREMGVSFSETPADLKAFGPEFGAAHLFIDDCADGFVTCNATSADVATFTINTGFCYVNGCCQPCTENGEDPHTYWTKRCYEPGACMSCLGGCRDDGTNHCTVAGWNSWLLPCAF